MKNPLLFIAALLMIAGCGPGLVYRQLDWVVPWYVTDYLDLSADQRSELDRRLSRQLQWHCQTQLPRYAALLRKAGEALDRSAPPATRDVIAGYYDTVLAYRQDLLRQLGPEAAGLLATTSERQIEDLFERLERQNQRLTEKYLAGPADTRIDNRRRRMVDRIEEWVGPLTTPQQQAVAAWSAAVDDDGPQWMAWRRSVQHEFQNLLMQHRTDSDFHEAFTMTLLAPYPPAYRIRMDARRHHMLDLLSAVTTILTPPQRDRVTKRIDTLATTLDGLGCPAAAGPDNFR